MDKLPDDLLIDIISKLNIKNIFKIKIVNKRYLNISNYILNNNNIKISNDIDIDTINKIILRSNIYFFKLLERNINIKLCNINTIIINKDFYFFKKCFNYDIFKKILYNRFSLGENPIEICDKYGYNDKKAYILSYKYLNK